MKRTAQEIMDQIEAAQKARAQAMPAERDAIMQIFEAFRRLEELGWREAHYARVMAASFLRCKLGVQAFIFAQETTRTSSFTTATCGRRTPR